jgi:hypothetical protein
MIRYIFKLVTAITLITTLCTGCAVQTAKQKPTKPNVIVIYTDDWDMAMYHVIIADQKLIRRISTSWLPRE